MNLVYLKSTKTSVNVSNIAHINWSTRWITFNAIGNDGHFLAVRFNEKDYETLWDAVHNNEAAVTVF